MKRILLILSTICFIWDLSLGQSSQLMYNQKWVLPPDNSTSLNSRIPRNAGKYFQREEYLILASEMATAGYPAGYIIDTLGFHIATPGVGTQTGNLEIWLMNTNDITYTLGNSWTTAGFTHVCTNMSFTVPIEAGPYSIPLINDSIFTYTGGGVYVAWQFSNPTLTGGTTPLVASCNISQSDFLRGFESDTALPTVLVISAFRPATFFANYNLSGLQDNKQDSFSFQVYPIPSNGCFTATISSLIPDVYNIRVLNNFGVEIYSKEEIEISGSGSIHIDLKPVSPGVYTVLCIGKENFLAKKIIIN
jgi:hypothetical protein